MATVQTAIVDRALRIVLGVETAGTAAQSSLALTALNSMIDSWINEGMMAVSTTTLSKVMVPTVSSYTFGVGGTFSTTRPVEILDAYMRQSNTDTLVNILTRDQWNNIQTKNVTSNIVTDLVYNPVSVTGVMDVYPVPSAANTLFVTINTPLTGYSTLGDTVALPPGWERALYSNLAIELAPEYGAVLSQDTYGIARESKSMIKRVNISEQILMIPENAVMFASSRSHILTDS